MEIKNTLKVKQIADYYKSQKEENVHSRRVEISNGTGSFKVIFNDDFDLLPYPIQRLDEIADLNAEVEITVDLRIKSRQKRIDEDLE